MKQGGSEEAKQRAGESAAELVEDEMTVGLGTGSTAATAIEHLGDRVDSGLDIEGIPTSYQSRETARVAGIPLTTLDESTPDIAIDGADQFAGCTLIKGGGAAHTREKVVDSAADRFVVVADTTKETEHLDYPVPVEVLPDAHQTVSDRIEELNGDPSLRQATRKDGPVITDNGNVVLDCHFELIRDPAQLATQLSTIPGVLEHGLFVDLADEVHVATADEVRIITE